MRDRGERRALTDKVIARRLNQLRFTRSTVPVVRRLADDSAIGRCGHKRCVCHWIEKNKYDDRKNEAADAA